MSAIRVATAALFLVAANFAGAVDRDRAGGGDALSLANQAQQGQLLTGRVARGATIAVEGRTIRVGADGTFVVGVGRDAPSDLALDVAFADGVHETKHVRIAPREYKIERVDGLPQHTVTPDPDIAARIEREQAEVAAARKRDDDRADFLGGFVRPAEGRISGVYGSQRIDNGTPKAPHMGLDVAVPTGTPVRAPAAGVVTFAAPDLVLTGGTVLIDHGFGLTSSLLHMSRLDVNVGDRVTRGQIVGASGMTGRASGPHVHWGFNWFDVRLDPALLPEAKR